MSTSAVATLVLIVILGSIFEVILASKCNVPVIGTPNELYENTKMNWFGCWFCYILIRVFSPVVTIIGGGIFIICSVLTAIEWLFTVGRNDD